VVPALLRNRLIAVVLALSMLLTIFAARPAATSAHISSYCGFGASSITFTEGAYWFDEYAGATGTPYRYYAHYLQPLLGSWSYGYTSTRYCGDEITPDHVEVGIPAHLDFSAE
jgi:hypothetical protein